VQHIANGLTSYEIAEKTTLSERTVENRILRLKKRLGCKNITHLATTLLRAKLIK
jgi:DNA-binding NarL/FixJ family response regulator